jgi:hypothetical protein
MAESIQQTTEKGQNQVADAIHNNISHHHYNVSPEYVQKLMPSDLAVIIPALIPLISDDSWSDSSGKKEYEVEEKITLNSVVKYAELIREYSGYSVVIEKVYDEQPDRKRAFLQGIRNHYLLYKGELFKQNPQTPKKDVIQNHADSIIDFLNQKLTDEYTSSSNASPEITTERLQHCITMIVVAAFIDCKILENPSFYSI